MKALNAAIARRHCARGSRKVGDFPVYDLGEPRVDIIAALGLAEALEDEDLAQRFRRGT